MRVKTILFAAAALCALNACSQAKEQLGLTRSAPDEFAVVKRAPLEMPPDYSLRAPRPGVARPQEQHPSEQAQAAIFGSPVDTGAGFTKSEAALLTDAGADIAQPGIREVVDQETAAMAPKKLPVAKRLLNIGSDKQPEPEASVVDPIAEAERLKQNREAGQPVTVGETPTID
ncbi:MAG: DUF3035 domain-containing protein [Alphaproteobacteria bacterium]|nr:DUF3035 domain-containing protein [Alphaproteobacteria bacterium]MBU0859844.1 DUF3035 domain-containing protein [Alphaproteobacteria bacterium]